MRRLASAVLAMGSFAIACAACGGSVVTVDGNPDGGQPSNDAAPGLPGNGDASPPPSDAAPTVPGCPAIAPLQGATCPAAGLSCEYGGVGDHLLCSTIATCNPSGTSRALIWGVSTPAKDCISSPAANPAACPSSFAALPTGAKCPQSGDPTQCVYPEGVCGCASCMAGAGSFTTEWACVKWPAPDGCPAARPRVGTPCSPEGQSCMYATVCDVNDGEPAIACTNGAWTIEPFGADCALRQCGK